MLNSSIRFNNYFSHTFFTVTSVYFVYANLLQSCPTLCDTMDYSPPASSVHRILQARILKWVAIPFSRGPCCPRDQTCVLYLLHWQMGSLLQAPPGKPNKDFSHTSSTVTSVHYQKSKVVVIIYTKITML